MAKPTVQSLMLQKIDSLEAKVDKLSTDIVPNLITKMATMNQEAKDESKARTKIYSMIWGAITLTISLAGLTVAYFKK